MPGKTGAVIATSPDFYVPYFQVKVGGKPQDQKVIGDILSVSYKDDIEKIDSFDITINNWDAGKRTYKYSDSALFDPGQELELWMGYHGADGPRLMVRGQITGLNPTFPAGGGPTLVISGLNILHRLRDQPISTVYVDKTDSQVAKEIADRLGLEFEPGTETEDEYPYLFQDNQFDIIFLMDRARRIGYELYVKEKGADGKSDKPLLIFGRSVNVRRPTYDLEYFRTLIDFKPELTTVNQVAEVTVRGWDPIKKEKIVYTAKRNEIAIKGIGKTGNQAAIEDSFKQRREVITTKPVQSLAEAKRLATRTLEDNAKDLIKATGSTIGLPDLRAGSVVNITGAGDRFSGRYFVTATTHAIGDSGYTTQFACRREEVS